jgi:uncharacterized membrane protein YphA (DoxX/SURF4 family)
MARVEGNAGRTTWGLFLVRVTVGLLLVTQGWTAVQETYPAAAELRSCIDERLEEHTGLLAWWGETVLLANPNGAAFLWRWSLLVLGLLLCLGALTRPAGLFAAFLMLNAWAFGPNELSESLLLAVACCLSASIAGSGRHFGLDSIFDQHFPSWMTWVRTARSPFG